MRKIIFLTLAFCLIFAVQASAAELKIGVFNMQEVAMQSDAFKEAAKKMESEFAKEKTDLEKQQTSLNNKAEELKNAKGLTQEQLEDKQIAYMRDKREFDDKTRIFLRRVETAERRVQHEIASVIVQAVQSYGKANGYSLIMDSNNAGVFHATSDMDVTAPILEETNKVWKSSPKK